MIAWAPIKITHGHPKLTDIKSPVYSPNGQYALYVTDYHQNPHNTAVICVIDLDTKTIHEYGQLPLSNTNAWKYYWVNDTELIVICPGDSDDDFAHECPIMMLLYEIDHDILSANLQDDFECSPLYNHTKYPNALMHNNISQFVIGNNAYTVIAICGEFLLLPYDFRTFAGSNFKPIRIKCQVKDIDGYVVDLPFMVGGSNSYSPAFFCCGCRLYLPVYKEKGLNQIGLPIREWSFNRFAYLEFTTLDLTTDRIVNNNDSQNFGLVNLGHVDSNDAFTTTNRVKFWQDHRYVMYSEIPGTSNSTLSPSTDFEDTATLYIVDLNTARVEKMEGTKKGYCISSLFKGHMLLMNSRRTFSDNLKCAKDRVDYEFKYNS